VIASTMPPASGSSQYCMTFLPNERRPGSQAHARQFDLFKPVGGEDRDASSLQLMLDCHGVPFSCVARPRRGRGRGEGMVDHGLCDVCAAASKYLSCLCAGARRMTALLARHPARSSPVQFQTLQTYGRRIAS
jgi:hypothetical protein